jgi:protocatechuate 3,4-dioxygenase beta subunit
MEKTMTIDDDDAPVGHILSRREVLTLLGGSSAMLLAACAPGGALASPTPSGTAAATSAATATSAPTAAATVATLPSCIVRPALTEGPYFVDAKLDRTDIRSDPTSGVVRPGVPLTLNFLVSRVTGSACVALDGAMVDVWHCDALGAYSDVENARGQKFLRGFQKTDASGSAKFTTIYPGWYQGRAVHIHFKIRPTSASEFTSQLFFEDALSTEVFAQAPYSQKGTQGITRNAQDGIFQRSQGKLTLSVTKSGNTYAATFDIGIAS